MYGRKQTISLIPGTQYSRGDCADIFRDLSMVEKKSKT
jgi:hypothetical protein